LVKEENGGPLADYHIILNRWKNYSIRQCMQLSHLYLRLLLYGFKLLL